MHVPCLVYMIFSLCLCYQSMIENYGNLISIPLQTVLKSIDELRHIAFEMGTDQGSPAVKKATIARDNKKLGFEVRSPL